MVRNLEKIKVILIAMLVMVCLGGVSSMAAIADDTLKDNTPTSYTNTPTTTTTPTNTAQSTPKSENKTPTEKTSTPTVTKIPKAGKDSTIMIIAGASVVVAVISLLKIREYRTK